MKLFTVNVKQIETFILTCFSCNLMNEDLVSVSASVPQLRPESENHEADRSY